MKADKSADNDKKIDDLVKKLKDYKLVDDAHKTENETQIKQLIDRLQAHHYTPAPVVEGEQGDGDQGAGSVGDDEVSIGSNKIKIDSITIDTVNGWTESDIDGLTPEKATAILKKLGYVDNNNIGKMSANYKVLLLLQKSNVNVQCAKNPNSQDQMIQGKISNVVNTNGKLSYTIDNSTADGNFKFKYSFQQVNDKNGKKCFHLTKIEKGSSSQTGYIENTWKAKDYIFQNEKSPLLTTGNPLVSQHTSDTRIKLETELS